MRKIFDDVFMLDLKSCEQLRQDLSAADDGS